MTEEVAGTVYLTIDVTAIVDASLSPKEKALALLFAILPFEGELIRADVQMYGTESTEAAQVTVDEELLNELNNKR